MKKALKITKTVVTWVLVVLAVAMMVFTVVAVNTFDRNDRNLFGYKAFVVLSDSMSSVKDDPDHGGHFNAGDLIFVKEVDPSTLKEGDIVSYVSSNTDNFGETVTHMIRTRVETDDGKPAFVTYGTATGADDDNAVTYGAVLGKYEGKIAGLGKFFEFLKTTPGYIVCIFLPFLLLIGIQGINSIMLFKKYKKEQLAELEAEREKERAELEAERAAMAEERKRQEEMMQKLLEMQAAMQGQTSAAEPERSEKSENSSEA